MNEFELERMLDGAVASVANAAVPEGFAERLKAKSRVPGGSRRVLEFRSLDKVGGTENSRTVWGAMAFHAAVLVLLAVEMRAMQARIAAPVMTESEVILSAPPPLPPSAKVAGGGGGQAGPAPTTRGNPPKYAEKQLMPPRIHPVEDAKLTLEPTVEVPSEMRTVTALQQIGMPNAPNVGASLGNGRGGGIGSGDGNGVGPGRDGGMGGGLHHVGGSVLPPVVIFEPQAEFSEEARKSKVSGNVLVYFILDEHGKPTHIRVMKGLGMGLDEKALEAVAEYRFKPARENGLPVAVDMQVEVNFTIF